MKKLKYISFILLIFLLCGCSSNNVHSKDFFYMDTYINIKLYSNNDKLVNKTFDKIDAIFKDYHQLTDRYNEYGDIKNIYYINNKLKENETVKIDKRLYEIIKYAVDFYDESNGQINIALGNVIDVWKQYRDGLKEGIPTIQELQNSGSINLDDLILSDNYLLSKKSNLKLDLGAFAKGYTTEMVGRYLESVGLTKYLINAGGNVKAGNHYANNKYKIGIEKPTSAGGVYKVVNGNNIAVTTSGSYERFYEYKGVNYHHIIDSQTLFPPHYMLSVTVISKDSALTDALDTILFLMPIEDGIRYVNNRQDVEAIWYGIDNKVYYSEGFKAYE